MISVVIPLYNKEKSIASTLQSVYEQTYTDYEVVIVNDGSTDNSANVVKDFIAQIDDRCIDDRWTLICQENAGVSAARNRGIIEAKGEYVAFLDGDDLWDKDFLKELVRLKDNYPGKSIYGMGCAKIFGDEIPTEEGKAYYRGESRWDWNTMAYSGSSACVNKKDAIEVGLFDTRMTHGEDIDLWWRLLLKNGGACYQKPFAYYRQDAENRAMLRVVPLEKFMPYYMDKFEEAREKDREFRKFYDQEMVYRIYPYLFDKRYKKEAKQLAAKLDYGQLKFSMWLRLRMPHLYRLITKK